MITGNGRTSVDAAATLPGFAGVMHDGKLLPGSQESLNSVGRTCEQHGCGYTVDPGNAGARYWHPQNPGEDIECEKDGRIFGSLICLMAPFHGWSVPTVSSLILWRVRAMYFPVHQIGFETIAAKAIRMMIGASIACVLECERNNTSVSTNESLTTEGTPRQLILLGDKLPT